MSDLSRVQDAGKLLVLRALQNGASTITDAAAQGFRMSASTFSRYREWLTKKGIIKSTTIVIDRSKLGFGTAGFFRVECHAANLVAQSIAQVSGTQDIHYIAGFGTGSGARDALLVKAVARTTNDLEQLKGVLEVLPGVRSVICWPVMWSAKETLALPI